MPLKKTKKSTFSSSRGTVEKTGQRVKFKGLISCVMYPKNLNEHYMGGFAIVKMRVLKVLQGDSIYVDQIISVKGNMPRIEYAGSTDIDAKDNVVYIVSATEEIDSVWGLQYEVESMRMDFPMESPEDQRKFLSRVLTENQVDGLFSLTNNPMKLLEDADIESLIQIKGVSNKTAQRLIDKYNSSIDNANAYVSLADYGLTNHAINKLVRVYRSPDIAIARIQENPYILIREVRGYGWKKADEIARAQGIAPDSEIRVKAYTEYYLTEQCEANGHSWMDINVLLTAVQTECAPISDQNLVAYVHNMLEEEVESHYFDVGVEGADDDENRGPRLITDKGPLLYFDPNTNRAGLRRYHEIEESIANNLYRIQTSENSIHFDKNRCADIIKEVEAEQGFAYTEEQRNAIWNILNNQVSILTGKAGCVDGETEFFSQNGWKKIKDFKWGDQVLQYNDDGTTNFVQPELYHKEPEEFLYSFSTKHGINQKLSKDHSVITVSPKGAKHTDRFEDVMSKQNTTGFYGKFITGFKYDGPGIPYDMWQIRMMVAGIADGSYVNGRTDQMRFHLKKERKKERLRWLAAACHYKCREHASASKGYTDFYIDTPLIKTFDSWWYNCSHEQLQIIADELVHWDGSVNITKNGVVRKRIFSSVKQNADFIQFVYSAIGSHASIFTLDRQGQLYVTNGKTYTRKSVEYDIQVSDRKVLGINTDRRSTHVKTNFIQERSSDGYKYCFTVPSHAWVMRYKDCIAVTGNCGKSFTVNAIVKILQEYGREPQMCALSGRASSKLTEITHVQGSTIHKLLAYNPIFGGFTYDEQNKLPCDMVILDEASMVGGELFSALLKAIPNGAKFLMVGDIAQLESIGMGNVLKDCMASGVISSNILTKIHRQAQQSGIITESLRVSQGEAAFSKDAMLDADYRGELKDLKFVTYSDYNLSQLKIIEEFKEMYLTRHIPAKDIQVIVPMRSRGNISCRCLNEELQKIVNPGDGFHQAQVEYNDNGIKWTVTYKEGDRIIITKNDYKAMTPDGKEIAIFNGNMGYIKRINHDNMIIELLTQGEVILYEKQYRDMNLSYCVTCHKLQGSSSPYVIFGIDNSCFALFSRELIYTGLTRARKFCSVVVQNSAFFSAIKISRVKLKQTWLKDDLQKLFLTSAPESDIIDVEE